MSITTNESSPNDGRPDPTPASQISQEIRQAVRAEVELQLAKEQKILKDAVGLAAKIVGAAATLFLAIFTLFGITTWRDIKKETSVMVKVQAEQLLSKADSETSVKRTLNDLLNRTLVSAFLTEQAKTEDGKVEIAANDWNRLRDWIKEEDLPLQNFSDTLAVLNLQSEERKKTDANRLLSEMLSPPSESPYKWTSKQPEKVEAILDNFKHKDLGSSAVNLVESKALTESIRSKAATYVREVEFSDGVERLLAIYKRLPWGETKSQTLVACAALRPSQSEVLDEVQQLLEGEPRREKLMAIASIISLMPESRSNGDASGDKTRLNDLAATLLNHATDNGMYFDVAQSPRMFWRLTGPPKVRLMIPQSENSAYSGATMSLSEFGELEIYWSLLNKLANTNDMKKFNANMPRTFGLEIVRSHGVKLAVTSDPGSSVTTIGEDGTTEELRLNELNNAYVQANKQQTGAAAVLVWIDPSGKQTVRKIHRFNGSTFAFSLWSAEAGNGTRDSEELEL